MRAILILIATICLGLGLMLGTAKQGDMCGSVLAPDSRPARIYDSVVGPTGGAVERCESDIAAQRPLVFLLLGVGAAAGLLAIVVGRDQGRHSGR